jgi:hypothetical protein
LISIPKSRQAVIWLAITSSAAAALSFLFPDSIQQDGGFHFLFARWAWTHPELFVGVWARPLFTTVFGAPALAGYSAAKLYAVVIAAAVMWQTYRFADDSGIARAPLVIPLMFLQPSFFVLSADTMTEPIFALVLVIALRLRQQRHHLASATTLSFSVLARPEGFFICALWALFIIIDARRQSRRDRAFLEILLLATGAFVWWMAALAITRDPLFIIHNWPPSWPTTGTIYGRGAWWNYLVRFAEIVPPLFIPAFAAGLWVSLQNRGRRQFPLILPAIFLSFFLIHSVLRAYGLMGSAGYPRYFVAISPVLAILTLEGWNLVAEKFSATLRTGILSIALSLSAITCFFYFDGAEWIRDTRAIDQMHLWFSANSVDVKRFVFSQVYSCIRFDRDPWENITFSADEQRNLDILKSSPKGTLALWDKLYGPKWHHIESKDFEAAGYELLYEGNFLLKGYILPRSFFGFGGPRNQRMFLYYKRE